MNAWVWSMVGGAAIHRAEQLIRSGALIETDDRERVTWLLELVVECMRLLIQTERSRG